MVLSRAGLTSVRLVLGVALDATIGVESTDGTVQLAENLATFLNQGLDLLDESFLVKHWLFGWRAKGGRCEQLAEVIPLHR